MKRIYVTEDDLNSRYAAGAPEHDYDGCPWSFISRKGPGTYELVGDQWTHIDMVQPTFETMETVLDTINEVMPAISDKQFRALTDVFNYAYANMMHMGVWKEEWIENQVSYGSDKEVASFIALFRFFAGRPHVNSTVYTFTNGFCYFFALMLQDEFKRGKLVEVVDHGHVVWKDNDGTLYDINGIYLRDCEVSEQSDLSRYKHRDIL